MKGIVLCADPCGDLSILKNNIPKAMIPVGNKPIMDWMLMHLKRYEIKEIMAALHSFPEEIQDYFGDGSRWGLRISYSQDPKLIGNAGSLKRIESFLDKQTFIVVMGGILGDIDIMKVLSLHNSKGAIATLGLVNRTIFGKERICLDKDGVTVMEPQKEHRQQSNKQGYQSCGVYVLEPRIFEYIPQKRFFDFEKNLLPMLLENNEKVCGYIHKGYWFDLNTFDNFKKANFDFLSDEINIKAAARDISFKDGARIGKGTEIHDSVQIQPPVSIGNDCLIREDTRLIGPAMIGNSTIIDKDVSFQRAIIWGRGYIGRDSCVNGALIGDSTYISSDVEIHDKTIIGLNCIVGPHSLVREGAILNPGTVIKKNSTIDYTVGNKVRFV